MRGTWRDRSGQKLLIEQWINTWKTTIDLAPKTEEKYKNLVEFHILPQFQGRELGSLTFEEIEAWEKAIPASSAPAEPRRTLDRDVGTVAADHHPRRCRFTPARSTATRPSGARAAAAGSGPRDGRPPPML